MNSAALHRLVDIVMAEPLAAWRYKAEGAANVAFSYCGSSRALHGLVMRIRKSKKTGQIARGLADAGNVMPADPLSFASNVMRPLIGAEYVVPGLEMPVPATFLQAVHAKLQSEPGRPHRRRGDAVDEAWGSIVLMVDHTTVPIPRASGYAVDLCVEIKPKSGVHVDAAGDGSSCCRYCMHQVTKAIEILAKQRPACCVHHTSTTFSQSNGAQHHHGLDLALAPDAPSLCSECVRAASAQLSHYCPLDLYSRDGERVRRSITALLHSPQNNFRLFVDGQPAFTAEGCARVGDGAINNNNLELVLKSALSNAFTGGVRHSSSVPPQPITSSAASCTTFLVDALVHLLCADPVLSRLQQAQSLGSVTGGLHGAAEIYADAAKSALDSFARGGDARGASSLMDAAHAAAVEAILASRPAGDPAATAMKNFLISQSAKDCSMLIATRIECHSDSATTVSGPFSSSSSSLTSSAASPDGVAVVDSDDAVLLSSLRELLEDKHHRSSVSAFISSLSLTAPDGLSSSIDQGSSETQNTSVPISVTSSIAVVDLDVKPISRIPAYVIQDRNIQDTFKRYGKQLFEAVEKVCAAQQATR